MTLPLTSEAIKPSERSPDRQFYSKDGALNPDHRGTALHRAREVALRTCLAPVAGNKTQAEIKMWSRVCALTLGVRSELKLHRRRLQIDGALYFFSASVRI